jgi:hypothetical protein
VPQITPHDFERIRKTGRFLAFIRRTAFGGDLECFTGRFDVVSKLSTSRHLAFVAALASTRFMTPDTRHTSDAETQVAEIEPGRIV